jgi:hypothetical protein
VGIVTLDWTGLDLVKDLSFVPKEKPLGQEQMSDMWNVECMSSVGSKLQFHDLLVGTSKLEDHWSFDVAMNWETHCEGDASVAVSEYMVNTW